MRIKATIVAYAFSVQCFENATIVAYAGLRVKRMRVSNACNTNFRLFIVLGDELLIAFIYFTLYLGHA